MMEKVILLSLALISLVNCNEFIVVSAPKSIVFDKSSELPSYALPDVLAASLGYSTSSKRSWNGLHIEDPFNTAKGIVTIVVEDADNLQIPESRKYNIVGEVDHFESILVSKVSQHNHLAMDVDLVNRHIDQLPIEIGEIDKTSVTSGLHFLKYKEKSDKEFVDEILYLDAMKQLFSESKPTLLNIRVSLKSLSKASPSARKEAQKLLVNTISKLNQAAQKAYNGNALVAVVTVEEHAVHSRSKRQATEPNPNPYNLADLSSPEYPVIFNIIFWFSIVFIFSLIAISLALGYVEDKDSIIYRMTGARGKKEN